MTAVPFGNESLGRIYDERVVAACEQNYIDYWACAGARPYAEFSDDGGIVRAITGLPNEIFNVVLRCDLREEDVDGRIDCAIDGFKRRRLPIIWHVGQLTKPSNLGDYLEARGFPHDYDLRAMAVEVSSQDFSEGLPEGVRVIEVATAEQSAQWIRCLVSSWHLPDEVREWMVRNPCYNVGADGASGYRSTRKLLLGYLKDRPVSAAMIFWRKGIAGLQGVGTIPEAQNRGAGTATIRAAMMGARSMGFGNLVVLSTVEGVRLYERAGFKAFGRLPEHSMRFDRDKG